MKKIALILALLILLTACGGGEKLKTDVPINSMDHPSFRNNDRNIAFDDKGMYLARDGALYYKDKAADQFVFLTYLCYADDQPIENLDEVQMESYREDLAAYSTIILYDQHLYFITRYSDIEGQNKYYLNRVDSAGQNKERLTELTFEPAMFVINQGHVLITGFSTEDNLDLHLFSPSLEEKVIETGTYVGNMYPIDGGFLFDTVESDENSYKEALNKLDYEGQVTKVDEVEGNVVFATDKYYILCQFLEPDAEKTKYLIKDYEGKVLVEEEDEEIVFVDDNYYYTESKGEVQEYGRYHLDGKLDSKIIPSQKLENLGRSIFKEQSDFDSIARVIGDKILSAQLDEVTNILTYFTGSFETGEFQVLQVKSGAEK